MPRTKTKPTRAPKKDSNGASPPESTDVLTLAEAAAYLRVTPEELLTEATGRKLPGRQVGSDWRFLRSALQEWLRGSMSPVTEKETFWQTHFGALREDPFLEEIVKEIYEQRGRPRTEED